MEKNDEVKPSDITWLRAKLGEPGMPITQAALAAMVFKSRASISRMENGTRRVTEGTRDHIARIVAAKGIENWPECCEKDAATNKIKIGLEQVKQGKVRKSTVDYSGNASPWLSEED